jgi:6,7-dimethyl-8-ribityllumazine synthase
MRKKVKKVKKKAAKAKKVKKAAKPAKKAKKAEKSDKSSILKKKMKMQQAGTPAPAAKVKRPRRTAASANNPQADLWGVKVACVVSQFNSDITDKIWEGASNAFGKSGVLAERYDVPGAFEIPGVVNRLARSRRYDGLVAIGCVIKGDTDHYQVVVDQVREGVGRVSATGDVPVTYAVLSVNNRSHALSRAGGNKGNVGEEAATALVNLVTLYRRTSHPLLATPAKD